MNESKIRLITFHRAQSYGAFLQAYALQNCDVLQPYSPIILDYYPNRFHYLNYVKISKDKSLIKYFIKLIPAFICKTRMHISAQYYVKKYLRITQEQYSGLTELEKIPKTNVLYMSGSDQIWDLRYDKIENVLPYYLSFADGNRVAYASSCGEMEYFPNINKPEYKRVLDELHKFQYISTRESKSAEDINNCGGYNAEMMLDPTFLLNSVEWNKLLCKRNSKERYVLIYGLYRNSSVIKYAQELAQRESLKIFNVCDMLDYVPHAKNIFNVTPFKLLWLIKNASHVVTDSFHGCALSINFQKDLHIFMPQTSKIRIRNIVELFKMQERVVNGPELIVDKMDYSVVNEILQRERVKAKQFLQKCVKLLED